MSKPKKLNYRGSSKVIAYLASCVNWLLDNGSGGVANVTVTPIGSSGDKIAEITVDSTTSSIYAPHELPFTVSIDQTDNGVNIVYDDSILNGGD